MSGSAAEDRSHHARRFARKCLGNSVVSIGSTIRGVLGNRLSRKVGHYYRAFFVDLSKVAQALSASIPENAHVLDIGGGDGEPLNYLLELRPDIRVTSIDLAPDVGKWLNQNHAARVLKLPSTSISQYLSMRCPLPDVIMLNDVVHHIPEADRHDFFSAVSSILRDAPDTRILVKDVEPGHMKSLLGYWADKYITGDRNVSPVAQYHLKSMLTKYIGPMRCVDTGLFAKDKPNYALLFHK